MSDDAERRAARNQAILAFANRFASTELLLQLRWEMTLRARGALAAIRPRQRALLARIRREHPTDLKINLGSGPLRCDGWLNIDGMSDNADLVQVFGRPLDLPDGCAAVVFSEHVLEHLEHPGQSRVFLGEALRILRPGGYLRVIVPDAERVITAYANSDHERLRQLVPGERTPIEAVNRIFRERSFHRFAWDYALLAEELELAGFSAVRRAAFRDSENHALNIDYDDPCRIAQSLYIEARKPAAFG